MTYITQNIIKKMLIILIIVAILCLFVLPTNKVYAATTYTQTLKSGIESFPAEYKAVLEQIKKLHPNWTFEAYYTGLSWDTLILNETATHGRNRVIKSAEESWKCSCGNLASGYVCASKGIVKYYLDPRNFLNEVNIFQFLEISYNEKIHTIDGVKSAVKGTFLDNTVTYTVIEKKEVPIEEPEVEEEKEEISTEEANVNENENQTTENTSNNTIETEETTDKVENVENVENTENKDTTEKEEEVKTEIKDVEVEYTKHYAEIILEAAKQSNMSPYSIVTKIIQEVGTKGSSSVSGTYEGYKGYYNFYNLGAYDTGNAIVNGLRYARDKGWSNQYIAIIEGAKEIGNAYTNAGQNTAYFYKWDVVGTKILGSGETQKVSSSNMFWHQYMTNVQDPTSQSKSLYNTYAKNNVLDEALNFIIPIYENMPNSSVSLPSELTTDDGDLYYVNCTDGLSVRDNPTTSGKKLASLSKNTVVVVLEREYKEADGYKWDKVKLANGVTGYIASKYLTFKAASTAVKDPEETTKEPETTTPPEEPTKVNFKIEETSIVMIPGVTLTEINENATGELKTGGKIKVDDKEYTVVILGDPSCDGEVNSADLLKVVKHLNETNKIEDAWILSSADVNSDGEVNSADLLKIVKYLNETSKIEL